MMLLIITVSVQFAMGTTTTSLLYQHCRDVSIWSDFQKANSSCPRDASSVAAPTGDVPFEFCQQETTSKILGFALSDSQSQEAGHFAVFQKSSWQSIDRNAACARTDSSVSEGIADASAERIYGSSGEINK